MTQRDTIRIFIAGDSTAVSYPAHQAPMAGWGQMLAAFFTEAVTVVNEAICGRSSKSYIEEGHLARIADRIGAGDYLFVQFGHNDKKPDPERHTEPFTTYQSYLSEYVAVARNKGGRPVFLTSVQRRHFDDVGRLIQTHGDYPLAMKQVALRLNVPLLDLCARTEELYRSLGPEASKRLFVWLEPGEHPNYPEGSLDDTHFNEEGARRVAELVIREIAASDLPLKEFIRI